MLQRYQFKYGFFIKSNFMSLLFGFTISYIYRYSKSKLRSLQSAIPKPIPIRNQKNLRFLSIFTYCSLSNTPFSFNSSLISFLSNCLYFDSNIKSLAFSFTSWVFPENENFLEMLFPFNKTL